MDYILENKDIKLRALEPEDVDMLFDIENDRKLWQVSNTLTPFSRDILSKYISRADQDIFEARQLRLAISPKNENELFGLIDLFDFEPQHHRAGIGILILESHQNKGIASQALKLVVDYAFNQLDLRQLFAYIPSNNPKSRRLFEKIGFEPVGTLKDWIRSGKQFLDVELYQIINS